jgi:hypothetical protein
MSKSLIIFFSVYFATVGIINAQGFSPEINNFLNNFLNVLPQPITNLFNTFSKINLNINSSFLEKTSGSTRNFISVVGPSNILSFLSDGWKKINNWFESRLGVSLSAIFQALGNFFIYILELIVKLLRWLVSLL